MELRGRRVLVTGAGGFIGAVLARALLREGCRLFLLVGPEDPVPDDDPGIERWLQADVGDRDAIIALAAGAEIAVHLAGPPSVAASFSAPFEFSRVHVAGTAAVIEACRHAKLRRIVYLSTAEIYGRPIANPVGEDHPARPLSPYGAAKLGAEMLIQTCAPLYGFEAVILRLFSAYGPRMRPTSLLGTVCRQALAGGEMRLIDSGSMRDYCYVDDIAAALAMACEMPALATPLILNIGSGVGTSVLTIVQEVFAILHRRSLPALASGCADRPPEADIRVLVANARRAEAKLGWTAKTPLAVGLASTIEYFRDMTGHG